MITFKGHGIMKEYGREIEYNGPQTLEFYLRLLNIPSQLDENFIAVKVNKVIYLDCILNDNDTIHLFQALMGG